MGIRRPCRRSAFCTIRGSAGVVVNHPPRIDGVTGWGRGPAVGCTIGVGDASSEQRPVPGPAQTELGHRRAAILESTATPEGLATLEPTHEPHRDLRSADPGRVELGLYGHRHQSHARRPGIRSGHGVRAGLRRRLGSETAGGAGHGPGPPSGGHRLRQRARDVHAPGPGTLPPGPVRGTAPPGDRGSHPGARGRQRHRSQGRLHRRRVGRDAPARHDLLGDQELPVHRGGTRPRPGPHPRPRRPS
jgi:hypothetical protein